MSAYATGVHCIRTVPAQGRYARIGLCGLLLGVCGVGRDIRHLPGLFEPAVVDPAVDFLNQNGYGSAFYAQPRLGASYRGR